MKFLIGRTRTVELVLVVDNAEYKKYGSRKTVAARMLAVVNHVDEADGPLSGSQQRHSRSLPVPAAAAPRTERQSRAETTQTVIESINPSIPPFSPSYLTLHLSDLCCRSSGGSCRRRRYGGSCGRSAQHLQTSRALCQLRLCPGIRPETPPPPPGSTRASEGSSGPPPQPPHGEGVALWWSSTSWRGLGLPRDPLCSSAPTLALRTRSTLAPSEQDFHLPKHVSCDRAPQCFYIPPLLLNVRGASGGYWLRRWTGHRRVSGSSPDR
ncbi:unnamed protein product [Boreogadus saida]